MRVALVVERYVGLAPLWKLAMAESVCNVGHRHERNGLVGLDGCYKKRRKSLRQVNAGRTVPCAA